MAVDERARRVLQSKLQEVIGPEATDTLMDELGSLGREQLATRHDLQLGFARAESQMAQLRSELKTDMAELRAELKTDMAGLRGEFGGLRGEFGDLRAEFGDLRADVHGIRADVAERLETTTRTIVATLAGSMATIAAIAFGAARLG